MCKKGLKFITCFLMLAVFTSNLFGDGLAIAVESVNIKLPMQEYHQATLKGIKIDSSNPFDITFLIDSGTSQTVPQAERNKLISYFIEALAVENEDFWVNLSPYEADRVVADSLSNSLIGNDMLDQDYMLKYISSLHTHPETELGKSYWNLVNNSESFNKIWVVPGEITLYDGDYQGVIIDAQLDAQSEKDFLATKNNSLSSTNLSNVDDVISSLILPQLRKDLNDSSAFANLRQIYSAIIMARWFKLKFKDTLYRSCLNSGIPEVGVLETSKNPDQVFKKYVSLFKNGAYDLVKKTKNNAGQLIKKRYFTGGMQLRKTQASAILSELPATVPTNGPLYQTEYRFDPLPELDVETESSALFPLDFFLLGMENEIPDNFLRSIGYNIMFKGQRNIDEAFQYESLTAYQSDNKELLKYFPHYARYVKTRNEFVNILKFLNANIQTKLKMFYGIEQVDENNPFEMLEVYGRAMNRMREEKAWGAYRESLNDLFLFVALAVHGSKIRKHWLNLLAYDDIEKTIGLVKDSDAKKYLEESYEGSQMCSMFSIVVNRILKNIMKIDGVETALSNSHVTNAIHLEGDDYIICDVTNFSVYDINLKHDFKYDENDIHYHYQNTLEGKAEHDLVQGSMMSFMLLDETNKKNSIVAPVYNNIGHLYAVLESGSNELSKKAKRLVDYYRNRVVEVPYQRYVFDVSSSGSYLGAAIEYIANNNFIDGRKMLKKAERHIIWARQYDHDFSMLKIAEAYYAGIMFVKENLTFAESLPHMDQFKNVRRLLAEKELIPKDSQFYIRNETLSSGVALVDGGVNLEELDIRIKVAKADSWSEFNWSNYWTFQMVEDTYAIDDLKDFVQN